MTAAAAFAPPRVLGVDRAAMIRRSGLVAATVTSGLIVTIVALPQLTWLPTTDAAQPIKLHLFSGPVGVLVLQGVLIRQAHWLPSGSVVRLTWREMSSPTCSALPSCSARSPGSTTC